ncbi:MAG: MerR family transcriptional regulator [Planctomycetes bacterium]|nr:MerR family transcriptional regulator [Planctomycetota bacterium]
MNAPVQPKSNSEAPIKIGELARRAGLTRQTVHLYVQMGLLQPVGATKGGQRLFDASAYERVDLIRRLCASGYSLRDIREIFIKDGK